MEQKVLYILAVEGILFYEHKPTFFAVTQQPKSGLGGLIARHCGTHSHRRSVELLCMSDQLVAEAATYTTNNKHNQRKPCS
jgi:hypothetical protein